MSFSENSESPGRVGSTRQLEPGRAGCWVFVLELPTVLTTPELTAKELLNRKCLGGVWVIRWLEQGGFGTPLHL